MINKQFGLFQFIVIKMTETKPNYIAVADNDIRSNKSIQLKFRFEDLQLQKSYHIFLKPQASSITFADIEPSYKQFLATNRIHFQTELSYKDANLAYERIIDTQFQIDISQRQKVEEIQLKVINYRQKLEKRIKDLQNAIESLQSKTKFLYENSPKTQAKKNADITFLYSEPIREASKDSQIKNKQKLGFHNAPVGFTQEVSGIIHSLQSRQIGKINIQCKIAKQGIITKQIINFQPKILHFSCHGKQQELMFESEDKIGLAKPIKAEQIKKEFDAIRKKGYKLPDLIFINSCKSQSVGKFLQKTDGIRALITINQKYPISEKASQIFSQQFYYSISNYKTIQEAFEEARNKVKEQTIQISCCCKQKEHKHEKECLFNKMDQDLAHDLYHQPDFSCKCKIDDTSKGRHKLGCAWARKSLVAINKYYKQKSQKDKDYNFEIRPKYENQDYLYICCCPTEKQPEHVHQDLFEDYKKFQLHGEKNYRDVQIFSDKMYEKTEIDGLSVRRILQNSNGKNELFKRQQQLYEFLKKIDQPIILQGKPGVGTTSFIKKAAIYSVQRKKFKQYFYISMHKIETFSYFKTKLQTSSFKQVLKSKGTGKVLLIFDDCDDLLNKSVKTQGQLENYVKNLSNFTVVLILKEMAMKPSSIFSYFQLKEFTPKNAALFLFKNINSMVNETVTQAKCLQYVNKYLGNNYNLRNPKVIKDFQIYLEFSRTSQTDRPKMFNNSSIEKQLEKMMSFKNQDGYLQNTQYKVIEKFIETLKLENKEQYKFLIFISMFSEGIWIEEIKRLQSKSENNLRLQSENTLKFFKKNWEDMFNNLAKMGQGYNPSPLSKSKESEQSASNEQYQIQQKCGKVGSISETDRQKKIQDDRAKDLQNNLKNLNSFNNFYLEYCSTEEIIVKKSYQNYMESYAISLPKNLKIKAGYVLFIIYYSNFLQGILEKLRKKQIITEGIFNYSFLSQSGLFYHQLCSHENPLDLSRLFLINDENNKEEKYQYKRTVFNRLADFEKIYRLAKEHLVELCKDFANFSAELQLNAKKPTEVQTAKIYFLECLQNLALLIPSIFVYNGSDNSSVFDLIQKSEKLLDKIENINLDQRLGVEAHLSRLRRDREIFRIKLKMTKIGISLKNYQKNEYQLEKKQIKQLFGKIKNQKMKDHQKIFIQMEKAFEWENRTIQAYFQIVMSESKENQQQKIQLVEQKCFLYQQQCEKTYNSTNEPIMVAKQYLVLLMAYKKKLDNKDFLPQKKDPVRPEVNRLQFIQKLQRFCVYIFSQSNCQKLKLLTLKNYLELKYKLGSGSEQKREDISKVMHKLKEAEDLLFNPKYELKYLTEFQKFGDLCKQIREDFWKQLKNTIIILEACPLIGQTQHLIHMNRIKRPNSFRSNLRSQFNKIRKSEIPDVTVKFGILTQKKFELDKLIKYSGTVIYSDFRNRNEKLQFIVEEPDLQEKYLEVNSSLVRKMFEKLYSKILIIAGYNSSLAFESFKNYLRQNEKKIGFFIIDSKEPQLESKKEKKQLRNAFKQREIFLEGSQFFIKHFLKKITSYTQKIRYPQMKKAFDEAKKELFTDQRFKSIISIKEQIHKNVEMENFTRGSYLDLSPCFSTFTNVPTDSDKYAWRNYQTLTNIFEKVNFYRNQNVGYRKKDLCINLYGENMKTQLISELIYLLIEREYFSDGGIYLFKCKDMKTKKNSTISFEKYILQFNSYLENQIYRMPRFAQFMEFGEKDLIIFDDIDKISMNDGHINFIKHLIKQEVIIIFTTKQKLKESERFLKNTQFYSQKIEEPNDFQKKYYANCTLADEDLKQHKNQINQTENPCYLREINKMRSKKSDS